MPVLVPVIFIKSAPVPVIFRKSGAGVCAGQKLVPLLVPVPLFLKVGDCAGTGEILTFRPDVGVSAGLLVSVPVSVPV